LACLTCANVWARDSFQGRANQWFSGGRHACLSQASSPRADHLKPNRNFLAERYDLFRRAS
jgi:hypothetical protein